ncbi:prenyltransferase UbiA [Sesbania bispinosa]|nr:prenyltransferase UbiA [Sesbania bispinosa]
MRVPFVALGFEMLPILGNLCMAIAETCFGDWNDQSFMEDVEGSSLAALPSWLLSAIASITCSFDDGTGAGIKNFALAARAGFTDGTEGG